MSQEILTISPIDGSVVARRPYASAGQIQAMLSRAKAAQVNWNNTALAERKTLVARAVDVLVAHKDAIGEETVRVGDAEAIHMRIVATT